MKTQKIGKLLGTLGFIVLLTSIIDLLFYWPTSENVLPFVLIKTLYLLAGLFMFLENIIKPALGKTSEKTDSP